MVSELIIQFFRFFILLFVQVLVLDQIEISGPVNGYFNAYLYILFLLMLPVNTNRLLLLLLSFLTGLSIDMFTGTAGMHASACLVLGFARPGFLNLLAPREGYESTLRLSVQGMGASTFLVYTSLMTLLHHLVLYLLEAFTFLNFFDLLLRVISSTIFTMLLIVFSQILTQRSRELEA